MRQRLLLFINVEGPGVSNISGGFFAVLLGRAVEQVTGSERTPVRTHQLRRHEPVGRIHDDAHRLFAHRIERGRSVYGLRYV